MPPEGYYDTLMAVQVIDDIDRLPVRDIPPLSHMFPTLAPGIIRSGEVARCGYVQPHDKEARTSPSPRPCLVCRNLSMAAGRWPW